MVKRNEYIDDDNLSELSQGVVLRPNKTAICWIMMMEITTQMIRILLNILLFLTKINLSIS